MSQTIILTIAVFLLGAFLLPIAGKLGRKTKGGWLGLILIAANIFAFFLYYEVLTKGPMAYRVGAELPFSPSSSGFPFRIVLTGDALSGLLAFVFVLISSLALLFSWKNSEFRPKSQEHQYSSSTGFYVWGLLLVAGALGFLLAGDFFTLFVFYEINSIAAAGLISFFGRRKNLKSAFHYLAVFSVGSLFLLFGIGLLYSQYGFLNMAAVAKNLNFSFLDQIALALIMAALALKAGFFPFYFWRPGTYQSSPAPALVLFIVSSASAVYALFRIIFNVFGPSFNLSWVLILFSVLSIFVGAFLALKENNLKRALAYLAVSEVGYIFLGVSSGLSKPEAEFSRQAIEGGLFHLVNDVLDMSLLFLLTGLIIYLGRKENAFEIRGLARHHPWLAGIFLLGVLAVSGLPPLNGFASKMMIYESVFKLNPALSVLGILGSILILAVLVKIFASVFLGFSLNAYRKTPKTAAAVILILAVSMVLIGLFPKKFIASFINPAAESLILPSVYVGKVIN
jgi:multicomponent Na+:H+ antiporter subunit D